MKKIVFLLLCLTPLLLQAQSKARRGIVVGDPPDSMATIDSIKIVDDVLYFYVGTDTIFAALEDDLVDVDTVAHMLVDTLQFVFGLGAGNGDDVNSMVQYANMGEFWTVQDSLVPDSVYFYAEGTDAQISARMYFMDSELATDSTFMLADLSAVEGAAAGTSTFAAAALAIPPGKLIRCIVTSVTEAPVKARYFFFYHEKRAN